MRYSSALPLVEPAPDLRAVTDADVVAATRTCWRCTFFTIAMKHLAKAYDFAGCNGVVGHLKGLARSAVAEGRRQDCTCGVKIDEPRP